MTCGRRGGWWYYGMVDLAGASTALGGCCSLSYHRFYLPNDGNTTCSDKMDQINDWVGTCWINWRGVEHFVVVQLWKNENIEENKYLTNLNVPAKYVNQSTWSSWLLPIGLVYSDGRRHSVGALGRFLNKVLGKVSFPQKAGVWIYLLNEFLTHLRAW